MRGGAWPEIPAGVIIPVNWCGTVRRKRAYDRIVAFLEHLLASLDDCAQILVDEAEKSFKAVTLVGNEVASFFLKFEEAASMLRYISERWGWNKRSILLTRGGSSG